MCGECQAVRAADSHFVRPAHWAIRRWRKRCGDAVTAAQAAEPNARDEPRLWFTPHLKQTLRGEVAWCRRNGGVPLDRVERFALRFAFRFERVDDAD